MICCNLLFVNQLARKRNENQEENLPNYSDCFQPLISKLIDRILMDSHEMENRPKNSSSMQMSYETFNYNQLINQFEESEFEIRRVLSNLK